MRKRIAHWLAAATFALALAAGLVTSGTATPMVHSFDVTPTPTSSSSNPGGSGGGGG